MFNLKSFSGFIKENENTEREEGPYYALLDWEDADDPVSAILPEKYYSNLLRSYNFLVDIEIERQMDIYADEEADRLRRRGVDVDLRPGSPYTPDLLRGFDSDDVEVQAEIIGPFMELPKEILSVATPKIIEEFEKYGMYEK